MRDAAGSRLFDVGRFDRHRLLMIAPTRRYRMSLADSMWTSALGWTPFADPFHNARPVRPENEE